MWVTGVKVLKAFPVLESPEARYAQESRFPLDASSDFFSDGAGKRPLYL
jgi:hypothetical protein